MQRTRVGVLTFSDKLVRVRARQVSDCSRLTIATAVLKRFLFNWHSFCNMWAPAEVQVNAAVFLGVFAPACH